MASGAEPRTLQQGDTLPLFEVQTLDRKRVRYAELWQRKSVVLVCLPRAATPREAEYASALLRRAGEFEAYGTCCVVTHDAVAGVPCPAVLVADRWGEIQSIASAASAAALPDLQDLLDTVDYVQRRCPECEGEWR